MPYCENCGNEIKESAKFCHNCGNKTDIAVREENTENETNAIGDYIKNKLDDAFGSSDDELFEPFEDYDWEEYFGHLPSKLKVYLGENIPPKKLNAFRKRIVNSPDDEYKDDSIYHLYYDDTTFGKGHKGILVGSTEEGKLILHVSIVGHSHFGIQFTEIKQLFAGTSSLHILFIDKHTNEEYNLCCEFSPCEALLKSILNFYDENFNSNRD